MADIVTPVPRRPKIKANKQNPRTFYKVIRKANNSKMNAERGKPHQAAIAQNFIDDEQCRRHVTSAERETTVTTTGRALQT